MKLEKDMPKKAIEDFLKRNYKKGDFLAELNFTPKGAAYTYCYTTEALAERDLSKEDCYITLNTVGFKNRKIRRSQKYVRRLKVLYADIDTYKIFPIPKNADAKYFKWLNQGILNELMEEHFGKDIPVPSYVVFSGRGIYLWWFIDEHINALPRWKKVQKYLHEVLKKYGSDSSVTTDYARVFRAIGSINSKTGAKVEVWYDFNRSYTLYEIMQEYLPEEKKAEIKLQDKRHKSTFFSPEKEQKLCMDRLRDLKGLLTKYRDREDAHRESILFLYRYYNLCLYAVPETALEACIRLNAGLKHPLPEEEVIRATKSAEKYFEQGCSFSITNKKLVEFLDIRENEMDVMLSIRSEDEKKEVRRRRNRNDYLNRLRNEGKDTKKQEIRKRRVKLLKLLGKGIGKEEICKTLGISRATYYADLKVVEKVLEVIKNARSGEKKKREKKEARESVMEGSILYLPEFCNTKNPEVESRDCGTGPPGKEHS